MEFAAVMEIIMMITLGITWPGTILKSLKTKSTKGKRIILLLILATGYLCGIISKITGIIISPNASTASLTAIVMIFYIINFALVATEVALYFHYRSLEKMRRKIAEDPELLEELEKETEN